MDVRDQRGACQVLTLQVFDGFLTIGAHDNCETSFFERVTQHLLKKRFVLDNQNLLLVHVSPQQSRLRPSPPNAYRRQSEGPGSRSAVAGTAPPMGLQGLALP